MLSWVIGVFGDLLLSKCPKALVPLRLSAGRGMGLATEGLCSSRTVSFASCFSTPSDPEGKGTPLWHAKRPWRGHGRKRTLAQGRHYVHLEEFGAA